MLRTLFIFIFLTKLIGIPLEAAMPSDAKIWVAGHSGLVGSAVVKELKAQGYHNLILKTHGELDLCDTAQVKAFYAEYQPEYVIVAAAKVGGILANDTFPADFININLAITRNVIDEAYQAGVKKLVYLSSACIYPYMSPQPIKEEYLLTGPLELLHEPQALAKIAGLKMCQAYSKQYGAKFISLVPNNLYGPETHFDLQFSHVLPALIRKFVEAKKNNALEVVVWGSGKPMREFLYVDDLAEAIVWAMNHYEENEPLNVGTGKDISIRELAEMIQTLVGYKGEIVFDAQKPDGMQKRLLDVSKIQMLGWQAKTPFRAGLEKTIDSYVKMYP